MTPEEYERFKEAEKAHLRKLRELKKTHQQLKRKSRITGAVTEMAEGINNLFGQHEEMVDKLQRDSIESEARMEVALDNIEADDAALEALDAAELEADQALRKARAQELIRQMKSADGVPDESSGSSEAKEPSTPDETKSDSPSSDLPEKTIGRMKR